jgi:nucleolar protein 56
VLKLKYNLWFGIYEDGRVDKSSNLEESFLNAENEEPLPFSISEVGIEVFGGKTGYYASLRKVALAVAERLVERELRKEDRYVVALVKALEEVEEAINMLNEKLEDIRTVKDTEIAADFENKIEELKNLRKKIEREIEEIMTKIAPNLTEIAGAKVAAKLLERAGSMERFVKLPASKIQVIGAEKSLYKAFARMKRGKKAKIPKHGIIFLHPFIRTLPKSKRGKMARFLAAKIAIAAKIDYFRGEVDESLYESLRKRYEELRRK